MVKVLFYSSKEIYDKSLYEGRVADFTMERILAWAERDEEYKAMENQINA
jgi:hypothetical protein